MSMAREKGKGRASGYLATFCEGRQKKVLTVNVPVQVTGGNYPYPVTVGTKKVC